MSAVSIATSASEPATNRSPIIINGSSTWGHGQLAYGRMKDSGIGREGPRHFDSRHDRSAWRCSIIRP